MTVVVGNMACLLFVKVAQKPMKLSAAFVGEYGQAAVVRLQNITVVSRFFGHDNSCFCSYGLRCGSKSKWQEHAGALCVTGTTFGTPLSTCDVMVTVRQLVETRSVLT